jgi:RNA polymerase sigma factor (sigma-70 family)
MNENFVKNIIHQTICELKRNNLLKTTQTSPFQKTEKLLYVYPDIEEVDDVVLDALRDSLEKLEDDEDYSIIEMKYFEKMTHEEIAEELFIDPSTVTRRKNKIVKRLSFMLFPHESLNELIND